jgi:hypothetical protein
MTPHATPPATGFDAGPLRRAAGWTWPEALFWLLPVVGYFAFPEDLGLLSQIAITALFALSLDLILGYAGIVSPPPSCSPRPTGATRCWGWRRRRCWPRRWVS